MLMPPLDNPYFDMFFEPAAKSGYFFLLKMIFAIESRVNRNIKVLYILLMFNLLWEFPHVC
jgi:hypothetical protein